MDGDNNDPTLAQNSDDEEPEEEDEDEDEVRDDDCESIHPNKEDSGDEDGSHDSDKDVTPEPEPENDEEIEETDFNLNPIENSNDAAQTEEENDQVDQDNNKIITPQNEEEDEPEEEAEDGAPSIENVDPTPKSDEPALSNEEILQYFIQQFNLPVTSTGAVQDENLSNLLTIICKLLEDHHPASLHLSTCFIKENINSETDSPDGPLSVAISDYLARFTGPDDTVDWPKFTLAKNPQASGALMGTLISEICNQIKDRQTEENGAESLKMLKLLSLLGPSKFDVKTCFYAYYKRTLTTKDDLDLDFELDLLNQLELQNNPDPEKAMAAKVKTAQDEEAEKLKEEELEKDAVDLKNIQNHFQILERYSLVEVDKNDENEIIGVNILPIVKKGVRAWQKEGEDWAVIFELVELFKNKTNITTENEPHIISLHGALAEFDWPEKSYRHSLYYSTALNTWLRSQEESKNMLKDVYNFFINMKSSDKQDWRDKEYFNLCKMALVYLQNEENGEFRSQGVLDGTMDNSAIFHEADYLNKINGIEFFDWVLQQGNQYKENELIQHFTAHLLVIPVCVHEGAMGESKNKQIISWIGDYKKMVTELKNSQRIFNLMETPLTVIKLACQLLPSGRVMKMAMEIMKAVLDTEGPTKCSWFLQETLYLLKPTPVCVWESEQILGDLVEMRGVCKTFVDQGLSLFIEMLTDLEKMYSKDYYLDLHFLDFLETIKASAFFEDCVKVLLKSPPFFTGLQSIFNGVILAIEKNEDAENIKAACHILIFWYALLTNSETRKLGYENLIVKEMENFYENISQEESPVNNALDAEKHWHIYFREQGDTGEKILEKFLESQEESDDALYQLALRLKNTISRKEGWWLVSRNVLGGRAQSQAVEENEENEENDQT